MYSCTPLPPTSALPPPPHTPANHSTAGPHTNQHNSKIRPHPKATTIAHNVLSPLPFTNSHLPHPAPPSPKKKQQPCSTEAPVMMYRLHWSAQALMNRVAFRRLMPGQHLMLLPGHRQCKTKQTSILLRKCRSPRTLDLWWLRIPNGLASVWLSDPPFPPPALPPPPLPLRQVS